MKKLEFSTLILDFINFFNHFYKKLIGYKKRIFHTWKYSSFSNQNE